jgi:hypothetical protein
MKSLAGWKRHMRKMHPGIDMFASGNRPPQVDQIFRVYLLFNVSQFILDADILLSRALLFRLEGLELHSQE